MPPAARTMSAPSTPAEMYSALAMPEGKAWSGGEAARRSIESMRSAAARLTSDSRASESSPTDPVSHHAYALSAMVASAAAMESQAKRSRLVDFTRAGGGRDCVFGESCGRDFALFQLVAAIGHAFGEARALLCEEHGDPGPLHLEDGRGELVDDHRR